MHTYSRRAALFGGPVLAGLLVVFGDLDPDRPEVTMTAAVALLMAIWWISEVIPLAATSLLPVALFPLLGVMDGKDVASQYFNWVIFLFLGGFLVALAMERWDLHKRIALRILLLFGGKPQAILLGFMVATAFLSMWISNTATTMMMVPIALAIIIEIEENLGREKVGRFAVAVLLGVAYSASIGGIATLVGTPPNASFVRILAIVFEDAPDISFADWFTFVLPVTVVMLLLAWAFISVLLLGRGGRVSVDTNVFRDQYRELGPMRCEQWIVLIDFVLLAILWLTRRDIAVGGAFTIPGWSGLFKTPAYINDGTTAVAMAILLFLIPSRNEPGRTILDWEMAKRLPWNIILLFGGGFALAKAFTVSGLSIWVGDQLQGHVEGFHPLLAILAICLLITFLTELTSNTATTEMILPILAALAVALRVNPLLLMLPATLSCSCAFMLPVATPPNAIIFGTQRLRISTMASVGVMLNIIGAVVITLATYYWGSVVFGIEPNTVPDWAVLGGD